MPPGRSLSEQRDLKERIVNVVSDVVCKFAGKSQQDEAEKFVAWRALLDTMIAPSVSVREPTPTKCYDVDIKIATALFHRFGSKTENGLILESDYGVARHFSTVHSLSEALLPDIERQCRDFSHHVRIDLKTAHICILTRWYDKPLELSCPHCPFLTGTAKQLRWHLHHNHATAYKAATSHVEHQTKRDMMAVVVYDPLSIERNSTHEASIGAVAPLLAEAPASVKANNDSSPTQTTDNENIADPFAVVRDGGSSAQLRQALGDRNPNSLRDTKGALLLHWAASLGRIDLLDYLVEDNDALLSAPQEHDRYNGRTCLHWAARNGHVTTVQWILERDSNVIDAVTADGTTPFGWAAWQGHQTILQLLYESGCDVRQQNQFGCNAALWAAQGVANVQTMEWLHTVGCNVFLVNHAGHGVLHKSAQRGRWDICRWFIDLLQIHLTEDRSFDMVHRAIGPDNKGAKPSDLAAMEGYMEIAQYVERQENALLQGSPKCLNG